MLPDYCTAEGLKIILGVKKVQQMPLSAHRVRLQLQTSSLHFRSPFSRRAQPVLQLAYIRTKRRSQIQEKSCKNKAPHHTQPLPSPPTPHTTPASHSLFFSYPRLLPPRPCQSPATTSRATSSPRSQQSSRTGRRSGHQASLRRQPKTSEIHMMNKAVIDVRHYTVDPTEGYPRLGTLLEGSARVARADCARALPVGEVDKRAPFQHVHSPRTQDLKPISVSAVDCAQRARAPPHKANKAPGLPLQPAALSALPRGLIAVSGAWVCLAQNRDVFL